MKIFNFIALGTFLFLGAGPVIAQQKVIHPATVWPEIQVDYVFKSTSFLYFRNQVRHIMENDFNHLRENKALQYLERVQFRLGYEHVFNPNWSAGITEAYAIERTRNILFSEVYARHTNAIGKFRLSKRASWEHLKRWPKNDNGRFRFRADLDRSFKIGQKSLRPRVSYELFYNIDYHPQAHSSTETCWIDRSRFRWECQMILNNHVAFTPYFLRQTDYLIVEPTFDENNNILRPRGRQNHVTPVWGLELRYSVFAGGESFPRSLPLNK